MCSSDLSEMIAAGIFELAVREEPLYWATSLPDDPARLLAGYAFTRLMARQPTHLSDIYRPIVFASSHYWYVDNEIGEFGSWSGQSHARSNDTHRQSRRYYFGEGVFVKKMSVGLGARTEINRQEFHNEVNFLSSPLEGFEAPALISRADDGSDLYLARGLIPGRLLSEMIDEGISYDSNNIVESIVFQLSLLERSGLYHNDVRCWNILVKENNEPLLIDYGAISPDSSDCSWINNLMLSFVTTVKEIVERKMVPMTPGRDPDVDFLTLPSRYRNAFASVFMLDQSEWNFTRLMGFLNDPVVADASFPEWSGLFREMQRCLSDYNHRASSFFESLEKSHADLVIAQLELSESQDLSRKNNEKIEFLERDLEDLGLKHREIVSNFRDMEQWAHSVEKRSMELTSKNAFLSSKMEILESEGKRLRKENEDLKEKLSDHSEISRKLKFVSAENNRLSVEVASLLLGKEEDAKRYAELSEHKSKLELHLSKLVSERDDLVSRFARLEEVKIQREERIEGLEVELHLFRENLEHVQMQYERSRVMLRTMQKDNAEMVNKSRQERKRIQQLETMVSSLSRKLDEMYSSRSWRITAPLRWMGLHVRKTRSKAGAITDNDFPESLSKSQEENIFPGDVLLCKKLATLDQIGSRIRKKV